MANLEDFLVPDEAPVMALQTGRGGALVRVGIDGNPSRAIRRAEDASLGVCLPANTDAEKTILGSILLDNELFLEAAQTLDADDFSLDSHRRVFLRMMDLMNANRPVDLVTLVNELATHKEVEAVGGVAYLASLTEGLPRRPAIREYVAIVKDKAMLRRLIDLASKTMERAQDQSETALEIATDHASDLEAVVAGGVRKGLRPVAELSVEVMDRFVIQANLEASPGLSFGVEGIDAATGGIQEGEQVVVGCFSGVGKTTLLAQIVAANCPKGHAISLFLIEPTRHDFLRRLWSIVGQVRYAAAIKPWLATKEERDRLRWAQEQVIEWPLYILDDSNLYLDQQLAHQRLAMHRHKIRLSAIDYIQRLKVRSADKNDDTRLRIGRASTMNADLVKGTRCSSLILSQLSRAGGMNALPGMDRLRESGQLENDAATILLLHLKFDEEQGHFTDEGAAIIPKQRFGVPCNVALWKEQDTALWRSGARPFSQRHEKGEL